LCNPPRNLHDQFYTHPKAPKYEYKTKSVRFTDQILTKANARDNNDLEDMVLKMHNLSVCEPAYAALYAQICHHFPNAAKPLPLPDFRQTTAVAYQSPANQASASPHQPHTHHGLTNEAASFFGKTPRTDSCAFCTLQGHLVKRCPAAEEYVLSGRATIKDGRIHLGNGQSIPNDGSGRGLKFAIDSWIAGTGSQPSESSPTISIQTPGAAALSRDSPLQNTLSFEAVQYYASLVNSDDSDLPFPTLTSTTFKKS
jgi:hypothetical protein